MPRFKAGDTVRVHFQVIEGTRRRVQVFDGIVIKRQGSGVRETFTVRKISSGVGVERTFPLHSPKIEKIEVKAIGDVNRAKLYYLRDRVGKKARVRERRYGTGHTIHEADAVDEAAVDRPPRRTSRRSRMRLPSRTSWRPRSPRPRQWKTPLTRLRPRNLSTRLPLRSSAEEPAADEAPAE